MSMLPYHMAGGGRALRSLFATSVLALALPASAEGDAPQEIVVTATVARDRIDLASSVSVLGGADLVRDTRPQIGDTLVRLPGVSASSFGPNASRPVLRGLTGERVRVLTDGIGAFDVSNTSADHAVAIDPLTAVRIEVVRGPAALRFGGSAVGGVVNVLDQRIPTAVPEAGFALDLAAGAGTAASERSLGGGAVVALAPSLAFRIGGNLIDTDDLRTGGFILSPPLREEAAASDDPETRALAGLRGRIPNTDNRLRSAHAGIALIEGAGTLGLAVSHMENRYGVPIRFNVSGDEEEAERVFLDARQTRVDLRAGLGFVRGPFERLDLRGGYADYAHVEGDLDDPDDEGTLFENRAYELRVELLQRQTGNLRGAWGGQIVHRDFLAVGDEAFVPPNVSDEWGLFTVQELTLGSVILEGGARLERRKIVSQEADFDRGFTSLSLSGSAVWRFAPDWRLVASISRSDRPPAPEELLADGPHVGTQAFEIGDPDLGLERATAAEIGLRGRGEGWRLELAAYATRFSGFIYQEQTGEILEGLPVFAFRAAPARSWGLELDAGADIGELGGMRLSADVVADLVRTRIVDEGPAPRIPPARILGGIDLSGERIDFRAEVEHSFAQRRISGLETPTGAFTLVNLSLDWTPVTDRPDVLLSLSANNLFDAEARRHASFLKDFAPMAGRDIRLALRMRL
jgi:iron complex outermembrane receptor protein